MGFSLIRDVRGWSVIDGEGNRGVLARQLREGVVIAYLGESATPKGCGLMENAPESESPPPAATTRPPEQLHFTGTGGEYFGIWIVNLLLTIVTLGIYSAWAKVRRLQYFYRHTEVAGLELRFPRHAGKDLDRPRGRPRDADCVQLLRTTSFAVHDRYFGVACDRHAVAAAKFLPLSALQHELARYALSFSRYGRAAPIASSF